MSSRKRKHVNITIQQKLDILKDLERGKTAREISSEYNIGSTTVHDIKKNKNKLLNFSLVASESAFGIENRKTMKKSPYELLDRALIQWFNKERAQGKPITGPMCSKQAKLLFSTIGLSGNFDASSGWLARFKDRYGIRSVGDSLDCVWTIGIADQAVCEGETLVVEEGEGDKYEKYKPMEDSGNIDNLLENEYSTMHRPRIKESTHPVNSLINNFSVEDSCESELPLHIESDLQQESGQNATGCETTGLKYFVEKLEVITNKLTALSDSYDHFGRYISILLQGLPPEKVLHLKQKIVADVLQSVLAHERGIPEEVLSSFSCQSSAVINKTKPIKKKMNRLINNNKSNNKQYNDATTLNRKTLPKKNSKITKQPIDLFKSSCNSSCNFDYLMPDTFQASSSKDIPDQSVVQSQRSVDINHSGIDLSVYIPDELSSSHSLTYSQSMASANTSPYCSLEGVTCDSAIKQPLKHATPRGSGIMEAVTAQHRDIEEADESIIEEKEFIEFKKERETDEADVWGTHIQVKEECPSQAESSDETAYDRELPDMWDVQTTVNCGMCQIQCDSRQNLIHHFALSHPGCVPVPKIMKMYPNNKPS